MSRLLLLGANGQVGRELRRSLRPLGEVVCATRDGRLDAAGGEQDGQGDGTCEVADLAAPESLAALVAAVAVCVGAGWSELSRSDDSATERAETSTTPRTANTPRFMVPPDRVSHAPRL